MKEIQLTKALYMSLNEHPQSVWLSVPVGRYKQGSKILLKGPRGRTPLEAVIEMIDVDNNGPVIRIGFEPCIVDWLR
jgi:hypothetical protein